ncbi:cation transporter [Marinimicrobium sp. C6131]|nr:cation transporter [Marinimicrobium sp. C6131]UZJ45434.1 cation transporter [Marinimicrobium sp. C6131]
MSHTQDGAGSWVSVFKVAKMDCPSEERMVRLALDGLDSVRRLTFDLPNRQVRVVHEGSPQPISERLDPLGLGAVLENSEAASPEEAIVTPAALAETAAKEARILRSLLAINGLMFFVELTVGYLAQSAGLIADSLDMFADAAVYGLALYAVGRAAQTKLKAARLAGWLQLILAFGALSEVLRRFLFGSDPESVLMMGMALVALVANVSCLLLISRNRESGVHMKASWIFSANDVIANSGVILAGALVYWTGSPYPDLIIGLAIGLVVLGGARKILRLKG